MPEDAMTNHDRGSAPDDPRHRAMIAHARQQVATLSDGSRSLDGSTASVGPSRTALPADGFPDGAIEGYDLLDELHRGGQGVVYRAIQRSTNRTVAIKLLVHGAFATAGERRRFEREVELLARLDVPGIVRIVDSGVSSGRWWFAMDYIDGVPLDRVPRERRSVVELIAKVAEAIHAAHLRGVIHRDLKPRNILVDQRGQPHVLDFGLAHERPIGDGDGVGPHAPSVTDPGHFVGSLPWAAPEQVVGGATDYDLRTDLYALGVVLYQLLTDRFPYRVIGPLHEITRAIVHDPPEPPSAIDRSIDRDLETILLTCLQKDPARRYQSAAALAADLRGYLRGEPLAARRDSLAYVARLWFARHRFASIAAAGALLLLVAATLLTTLLWRATAAAQARAESESRSSAAVLRFLERTIGRAAPGSGTPAGDPSPTVVELMEAARRELDANAGRDEAPASVGVEAAVRASIAQVLRQLGRFDEAAELAESALALRERSLGASSVEVGRTLVLLSTIRRHQGRRPEATALSERALATLRAAHGGQDHVDVAEALVDLACATPPAAGDPTEADSLLVEAIEMFERLVPPDDERLLTARLNRMVRNHGSTTLAECEALVQRLDAVLGPSHEASIIGAKMLSAMQSFAGQLDAAVATHRAALDATIAVYGPCHPLTIDTTLTYAGLLGRRDGPRAAYRLLLDEVDHARTAQGASTIGWAQYQMELGILASSLRDPDAERWLRGALATFDAAPAAPAPDRSRATLELALFLYRAGSLAESERLARACLALPVNELAARHWTRAQATALLGQIALDGERLAEAESLLLAADQALRLEPARNARAIAGTARSLVRLYERWQEREPSDARAAALERWRREAGVDAESPAGR